MQTTQEIISAYSNNANVSQLSETLKKPQQHIHIKGLIGSSLAFILSSLSTKNIQRLVLVTAGYEEANYLLSDIENITGKGKAMLLPSSYKKAFHFTLPDTENILQRVSVLNEIKSTPQSGNIIITYPEAIIEKVVTQDVLNKNTQDIKVGDTLEIDLMNDVLFGYDFERVDFVYQAGQYAIRGGIVDIFSFSNELPYRVEFFGDEVDSIRCFDPETQLSTQNVDRITIVPNVQTKLLTESNTSFLKYIESNSIIWFYDTNLTYDIVSRGVVKANELYNSLTAKDKKEHPEWLSVNVLFEDVSAFKNDLQNFTLVEYGKHFHFHPTAKFSFEMKPQPSFNKDFTLLQHNLYKNKEQNVDNIIFVDNPKQAERLKAIFRDIAKNDNEHSQDDIPFITINSPIKEGFIDLDLQVAFYTDHQIFERYYKYNSRKIYKQSQSITLKELTELKQGDYITHIDHGVGKYDGLQRITVNGHVQEAVRLVYSDNDLLYVNINSLNRISKYSGKDGIAPKLNKLGSPAWDKLKSNTKKKVKDIARDLIKLYAQRKAKQGYAFAPDTYLQNELEASFLYEDTPDQVKATADVKKDMEASHPMDRLVCGDVGFGKTEIAIRAAFKAVADSKQVAVLVPTTILASQHYRTFKERLKDFPCNVDYINRFKSPKKIKETLQKLEDGRVDIIIGTHRLVNKDVKFKDLGLLIIDEEQKFGVAVKEKLKALKVNVDTLTLTATPIPRTLYFSLMGARDLSVINTPPPNRQPIVTELHIFSENVIREAINFEVERGGQVFFVHNRVQDIQDIAGKIKALCPNYKIGVGHGQMSGEELEDVMFDFIEGKIDILVATTIIEAGLDIPNANTIIINQAQNFGLSDLHQMRGRVGRSNKRAFCYLLTPSLSTLTNEARKRLSAIEEFSDLGSGFNVAMRDLDIRGAGNLLGSEQSGFVAEIGYDMYHKILNEAIQELKEEEFGDLFAGEKEEEPKSYVNFTTIDTDLELLIPDSYVNNTQERYNLYTEMSKIDTEEGLRKFSIQLADRFGAMPKQVIDLLSTMQMQWLAREIGFEKLTLKKNILRGSFISDQQSPYYQSEIFTRVLSYVNHNQNNCRLKENNKILSLTIDKVMSIEQAISILKELSEK